MSKLNVTIEEMNLRMSPISVERELALERPNREELRILLIVEIPKFGKLKGTLEMKMTKALH